MTKQLYLWIVVFFTVMLGFVGVLPYTGMGWQGKYQNIGLQYFTLLAVSALLVIHRPRVWPDYWTVGMMDTLDLTGPLEQSV